MVVFISSVISGMEAERDAVEEAVEALDYEVARAEDFGATTETPRRACLEAARKADLTVVLLGDRYGEKQESGLSATHEEFRVARDQGAVAVFIAEGTDAERDQAEFIEEAREWATGRNTENFSDVSELRDQVTRLVHRYAMRRQSGEVDADELAARARSLLPDRSSRSPARLHVIVVGGPAREVVSPARLDDEEFTDRIVEVALFRSGRIFDRSQGTATDQVDEGALIEQEDRSVLITEDGSVRVTLPAMEDDRDFRRGLPALIEEDVRDSVSQALEFASWLLDQIDSLRRLSTVSVLVALEGAGTLAWRTREEHAASPNRVSQPMRGSDLVVVPEDPRVYPRPAIHNEREEIGRDFVARLRREVTS